MKSGEGMDANSSPSYVHSRITIYYASKIDLKYCRSFHNCPSCQLGQLDDQCGAVHFGVCVAPARPTTKVKRRTTPYFSLTHVSQVGSVKDGGSKHNIPQKSASFSSPTNNTRARKTRSLAILGEGLELAGSFVDSRGNTHPGELFRLHPQKQGTVSGFSARVNRKDLSHVLGIASTTPSLKSSSNAKGVAITVSPNKMKIFSEGDTVIQIKNRGSEIGIRSLASHNIRLKSAIIPGAQSDQDLKVKGQSAVSQTPFLEDIVFGHAHQNNFEDNVDSSQATSLLVLQKSVLDKDNPLNQKPIARVAPAPILSQTFTKSSPTSTSSSNPYPLTSTTSSSYLPISNFPIPHETHTQIPAFSSMPVTSDILSLLNTTSSSSHFQPLPTNASSTADTKELLLSGSTKGNPAGNHGNKKKQKHIPDPIAVSNQKSNKKRLLKPDVELFRNNVNLKEHGLPTFPVETPLQGQNETKDPSTQNKTRGILDLTQGKLAGQSIVPVHIPQFYFPLGEPSLDHDIKAILQSVRQMFTGLEDGKAYKEQMGPITKACGFPLYWKILLFRQAGGTSQGFVTYESLSTLLTKLYNKYHNSSSRFMRLVAKPKAEVLEADDFEPLIQDIIETHPGLTFLLDAPEFHSRYVVTVISRIMYSVNRSWTGTITLPELRRSNFLQTVLKLEQEDDINLVTDYFSYEHFYVIYCKFWELDTDHDLFIDQHDLSRHNDHALNSRIIDRIFSGAVTRGPGFQQGRMTYKEFVWFLLSEVDKKHPTSIEYWFRCMDLDGDGVISMYEMEYFHEEQMIRLEALGIERLPFEDTVCQMLDMVNPQTSGKITLKDLKACKMMDIFFDTFINLDKFLEHEQKDPFANVRDPAMEHIIDNDWNRYAEDEYENLIANESNAELDNGTFSDTFNFDGDNINDINDDIINSEIIRTITAELPERSLAQFPRADDSFTFGCASNATV